MQPAIPLTDNYIPQGSLPILRNAKVVMRMALVIFAGLYFAFQKKLLNKSTSRIVARMLFWPTVPFTYTLRIGKLFSIMDETVILGVVPLAFSVTPKNLHSMGVRGIINLCDEFNGSINDYNKLGIEQLWLPTVDHYEPSVSSLWSAIKFISKYKKMNQQVYVHCKAGHGRAAAVVFCWLISQNHNISPEIIASDMMKKRKVRKNLHLQPNIATFYSEYMQVMKSEGLLSKEKKPKKKGKKNEHASPVTE